MKTAYAQKALFLCVFVLTSLVSTVGRAQEVHSFRLPEPMQFSPTLQRFVLHWLNNEVVTETIARSQSTRQSASSGSSSSGQRAVVGVDLNVGFPNGVGAAAVVRPWDFMRVFLGGAWNLVSGGIFGGLSIGYPFRAGIQEIGLAAEVGHFFEGDANWIAREFGGADFDSAVLRRVSYTYGSGRLYVEIGFEWFRVALEGGVSYVYAPVRGIEEDVRAGTEDDDVEVSDGVIQGWVPSAGLRFSIYLPVQF